MGVAAAFLWAPRNYKRMLAYSRVEHMGLTCLGIAFGGAWGVVGALLHVVNHALAKSALFILAGRILQRVGSAEVAHVRGLARLMPGTAAAFLAATLALVGLPPFGLFVSEVMILRAGFTGGYPFAAGAALVFPVLVFGGVLRAVNRMLYSALVPPLPLVPLTDDAGAVPLSSWPLVPIAVNALLRPQELQPLVLGERPVGRQSYADPHCSTTPRPITDESGQAGGRPRPGAMRQAGGWRLSSSLTR